MAFTPNGDSSGTPNIEGLQVFEIEVDGNDPRWMCGFDPLMDIELVGSDFPIKWEKRKVRYVLLTFEGKSLQEVINQIWSRGLGRPDYPTTRLILEQLRWGCARKPIAGICGRFPSQGHPNQVGSKADWGYGSHQGLWPGEKKLPKHFSYIAVVSEEPLQ